MVVASACQRVHVEELPSVQGDAAEHAVVERPLHDVAIAGVAVELQQPVVPQHEADGGAGLRVGGVVRQIIDAREALVVCRRSNAARQIHLPQAQVIPQPSAGGQQALVAELTGEVGHRAVQVHRTNSVPHRLRLLAHGRVRLAVLVGLRPVVPRPLSPLPRFQIEVVGVPASLLDEVLAQAQVPLLAGRAVELDEGQLDLLVAPVAALLP